MKLQLVGWPGASPLDPTGGLTAPPRPPAGLISPPPEIPGSATDFYTLWLLFDQVSKRWNSQNQEFYSILTD